MAPLGCVPFAENAPIAGALPAAPPVAAPGMNFGSLATSRAVIARSVIVSVFVALAGGGGGLAAGSTALPAATGAALSATSSSFLASGVARKTAAGMAGQGSGGL